MSHCAFCEIARGEIDPELTVRIDEHVFVQVSLHQKAANRGHVLVIPKRHVTDIFESPDELDAPLLRAVREVSIATRRAFSSDGIQVRQNNGSAAGQDVFHLHIHVIPRYDGDDFENSDYELVPFAERLILATRLKAALDEPA